MVKLRKKKINKGRFSLYLDIYSNGKRNYEFLKLHITSDRTLNKETLKLAEIIRAKRQIEMQSESFGLIPEHKAKRNLIEFLKYSVSDKNLPSIRMAEGYIKYISKFSKNILINEINERWLREFESYLASKVSNNSVINYLDSFKTSLNRAVRERIIPANPFIYFSARIKKTDIKKEYLTFEELTKLSETNCKNDEVKRAFLFACYTGLRISDIINLKLSDIKNNTLEFRMKKTTKNQQLPLSESAKRILLTKKNNNIHFINNEQGVFNLPCLSVMLGYIKEWVRESGIDKHITTHCARHTFATLSLTSGVDLFTVSKLLGHSDVKTTQIYAKIVDSKKVEAVNKLPELKIA